MSVFPRDEFPVEQKPENFSRKIRIEWGTMQMAVLNARPKGKDESLFYDYVHL